MACLISFRSSCPERSASKKWKLERMLVRKACSAENSSKSMVPLWLRSCSRIMCATTASEKFRPPIASARCSSFTSICPLRSVSTLPNHCRSIASLSPAIAPVCAVTASEKREATVSVCRGARSLLGSLRADAGVYRNAPTPGVAGWPRAIRRRQVAAAQDMVAIRGGLRVPARFLEVVCGRPAVRYDVLHFRLRRYPYSGGGLWVPV
mmetsp:Transcript_34111/g.85951  ORF Transcript_34111/g.85951 Transcript_34111/m.85951 type:complete len:208 (+) Transcript_34111:1791-2414(+)